MEIEGIRRRNVTADEGGQGSASERALRSLVHLDIYSKVQDDCVQRSQAGGCISMVTSLVVAFLLWGELREFLTVEVQDSVSVDTRIRQKLPIGLNITFSHLRCDEVSVDAVDSAGDNQVNVMGTLEKFPLTVEGLPVEESQLPSPTDCLPCLAGDDEEHKCCNSCESLKQAYLAKGISYFKVLDTAPQCRNSVGCRVVGNVVVNKVSGNVHVALGSSHVRGGQHVHEFNMDDVADGFNTSHEIHSISFGVRVPGVSLPLDGTSKIVRDGVFMFHYYIKLVPTVFRNRFGDEVYTHQYSSIDTARNVQVRHGELSGLPGVFIVYDFSPFLMVKAEKVKPWGYILTSVCALIGGVVSIASIVEAVANGLGCAFCR